MARLNTKFNYLTQIEGNTVWERIKTLQGFIEGRKRAMALKEVNKLESEAMEAELEDARANKPIWEVKRLEAKKVEWDSVQEQLKKDWELCETELKELLEIQDMLYAQAERYTHPDGTPYTDDEMFEANAELEFVTMAAKEIQASIIAHGRPTPTQVRWLMSCPKGEEFLRAIPNLVPQDMKLLTGLVAKDSNLYELLAPYKKDLQLEIKNEAI